MRVATRVPFAVRRDMATLCDPGGRSFPVHKPDNLRTAYDNYRPQHDSLYDVHRWRMDLVSYAFRKGMLGHIFVQKAPAASIETLESALRKVFNANNEIRT